MRDGCVIVLATSDDDRLLEYLRSTFGLGLRRDGAAILTDGKHYGMVLEQARAAAAAWLAKPTGV
jgi:hypothetical protein